MILLSYVISSLFALALGSFGSDGTVATAKSEKTVPISNADKVTLTLSVDTSKSGGADEVSPSILVLKVSNSSGVPWYYSADYYLSGLRLTVTDSEGNVLRPNERGENLAKQPCHPTRRLVTLLPGSAKTGTVILDHYFDLQPEHTYTVAIDWTFTAFVSEAEFRDNWNHPGVQLHAKSDPITFTVTKRKQ